VDNAEERNAGVYAKVGGFVYPSYRYEEEGMVAREFVGWLLTIP
jgi:hypothetical protein